MHLLDEDWGADIGGVLAPDRYPQEYAVTVTIPPVLPAGEYFAGCWIGSLYEALIDEPRALAFRLVPPAHERAESVARARLVQPPDVRWSVDPVTGDKPPARP
jgi:hypothetical protein